ncbi:MAG: hypothetical protein R3Y04_09620 [Rikenellaceae bacterium]
MHRSKLYHIGLGQNVEQSTLSRANESRDYRIFRDFGFYLISLVRPLYEGQKIDGIEISNTIFALDSTTISLSIKLFSWAYGKYSRGAVKVFFKWLKQNLTIKHLWGHSENAVNIHVWITISAYLIVAYLKAKFNSELSTYEILQVLSISAFDKTNLRELLTEKTSNQNVNEQLYLF